MTQHQDLIHFEDMSPGTEYPLGPKHVTAEEIVEFASEYDPQPMHLDADAGAAAAEVGRARAEAEQAELLERAYYQDQSHSMIAEQTGLPLGTVKSRLARAREALLPALAFDARGVRLGYGGGFYDRTLAALEPRPFTVGVGFTNGFIDDFQPEPHDEPLDAILNDNGVVWPITRL